MARLVADKDAHINRLTSLLTRTKKLISFFEKIQNTFQVVHSAELKTAAHSYVRMLSKLYYEFDIDDEAQKKIQSDIYAMLLSSVNKKNYRDVISACTSTTNTAISALTTRLQALELEIEREQ